MLSDKNYSNLAVKKVLEKPKQLERVISTYVDDMSSEQLCPVTEIMTLS